MDQIELQRCKDDIIYFVEKYLGQELNDIQKSHLKNVQEGKNSYFLSRINKMRKMDSWINDYKNLNK